MRLEHGCDDVDYAFDFDENVGDRFAGVVVAIAIHYLIDDFVGLGEKGDVEAFEDVIDKVVEHGHQQVFFFVVLNSVPNLDELLFHETEVILTLNLQRKK